MSACGGSKMGASRSKKPSEGSRWRLRRTRVYLWNFNRFLPGKPCQKPDLEKRWLSMRSDLSTMLEAAIASS